MTCQCGSFCYPGFGGEAMSNRSFFVWRENRLVDCCISRRFVDCELFPVEAVGTLMTGDGCFCRLRDRCCF